MAGIMTKETTTITKDENGYVVGEETTIDTQTISRSDEGDYIKVYFSGLDKLPDNLTMSSFRFLIQLSKYCSYSDINDLEGGMLVQITPLVREEMQNSLGIKRRTFYDNLKNLIDCNLICEVRKGCYQLNPMFLGKGYYEYKANYRQGGIKDLREYWKGGRKKREVVIDDNRYVFSQILEEVKKVTGKLRKAEKTKDYKRLEELRPDLSKWLKALHELSQTEYTKYMKYYMQVDEKMNIQKEEEEKKIQEELEEEIEESDCDDFSWFERNLDSCELDDILYSL